MCRVLWLTVCACALLVNGQAVGRDKSISQGKRTKRSLPEVVAIVLHETSRSGSVEYGWACAKSGDFSDPFRASVPQSDGTVIERLRTAFANEPSLKVVEDSSGLVRVVGGTFKTDLLDLKIKRIVFHNEADPMRALSSILNSPEVRAYTEENNIDLVPEMGGVYPTPSASSPHLDGAKENIRLSEALDLLPLTYSGMWSYKECISPGNKRMVAFHFLQWSIPSPR